MSDWYGGPTSGGGGSSWYPSSSSSRSRSTSTPKPKKVDPLSARFGGHDPHMNTSEWLSNFGGGIKSTIENLPAAVIHTGEASWYDIQHPPRANLFTDPIGYAKEAWNPPKGRENFVSLIAKPAVQDIEHRVHDPRYALYEDPFGTLLLGTGAASIVGKGALTGAERGLLGERAATAARAPRQLRINGNPVAELRRARTLQGRARQRFMDKIGEAYPDLPIIGAANRFDRIGQRHAYARLLIDQQPIRVFQERLQGLTPAEQQAFHVAYARPDIPIDDQLAFFRRQLEQQPSSAALQYRVRELESVKASGVLSAPRPEFVDAVAQARQMQAVSTNTSLRGGNLTKESWRGRRQLEAKAMLDEPSPSVLLKRESDWLAGRLDTGISPEFGRGAKAGAFERRLPHTVTKETAGTFSTPKPSLGTPRKPGGLRKSEGIRLLTGRFITNPEILSQDAMAQLRYQHSLDLQTDILEKVKGELVPDDPIQFPGGKPADAYYYHPSGPVTRRTREDAAITGDFFNMHPDAIDSELKQSAESVIFASSDQAKRLIAEGEKVYYVPKRFGNTFRNEFHLTGRKMRLIWDRPTDVWRWLVLGARPAWAINNTVTNATLYALHYAGPRGVTAFLRALLATERGPDKMMAIWKWTLKRPTIRRKYGRLIEQVFPELHQTGFVTSQGKITHAGSFLEDWQRSKLRRIIKSGSKVPVKLTAGVLKKFVDANIALNRKSEQVFRDAAVIREVQKFSTKYGKANATLHEMLTAPEITPETAARLTDEVTDALGDFNQLGASERRIIRRVVPFYSWYRTILTVTGKYASRYPERVAMIMEIGKASQSNPDASLQYPVPDWLAGAIPLGKTKDGEQSVLTTQAVNPFQTVSQLGEVAASGVHGSFAGGTGNPGGLLHPGIQALATGVFNKDLFYGGDYRGLGASRGWAGRAAGVFAQGLPEYRLLQQTYGGHGPLSGRGPIPKYEIPAYKSTLYDNSTIDYLLNWFGVPIKRVRVKEAKSRAAGG